MLNVLKADVIVTDLHMPGGTAGIALTADAALKQPAWAAGFNDFLVKPVDRSVESVVYTAGGDRPALAVRFESLCGHWRRPMSVTATSA